VRGGLVKSYGLFWREDEIDWHPGAGGRFRVLGRRGLRRPGLRLADFRDQKGIYILYGDYGPHYVGLTRRLGLGKRLDHHRFDHHVGKWDRFSWFGFRTVLSRKDSHGLCMLKDIATFAVGNPNALIADVEAMLIRIMGLSITLIRTTSPSAATANGSR
jgi:hypothetical protein